MVPNAAMAALPVLALAAALFQVPGGPESAEGPEGPQTRCRAAFVNPAPVPHQGIACCSLPLVRGVLPAAADAAVFAVAVGAREDSRVAPAVPLLRWPDGSLALLQVHVECEVPGHGELLLELEPLRAADGSARVLRPALHAGTPELPLPLHVELLDPWRRCYRAALVPDEGAGPGGVVSDSGAVRVRRLSGTFRGVDSEVAGQPLFDLAGWLVTFDREPRAELTLVLDNREPRCGPLGAVRFRGVRLVTTDDRLRFLPLFAVENLLPEPRPRPGGGFVQWLLAPGDAHYLGDGTAKAFRLLLHSDDGAGDGGRREAARWAHARTIGFADLDAVRRSGAFAAHGGPAPVDPDDLGADSLHLLAWRRIAVFGPYGGFGDPEQAALPGVPRLGDSMLHNALRWRSPGLLQAAEGMVLQHGLRPTPARSPRAPADTAAWRQGLPEAVLAAPHGFGQEGYEHVSALLLFDHFWLTGDPWAREELGRLGGAVPDLLAAPRFRTSRGEGVCLLAGTLCARATGDAELLAALAAHAHAEILPGLRHLREGLALPQPPHPGVLDAGTRFDAPWQMALLVRGLCALGDAAGDGELAAAAVRVAVAMAGPGWVEGEGPKTFVGAGGTGRYTVAALPVDRAGYDRMTIGAFALAAELAGDPATAAHLRARAAFLLDRELRSGPELPARWSAAANPWLQVAMDRRKAR